MKILAIIAFLLFTMNCYSQITAIAIKENEKEKPMEVLRYDSLESLNYENAPLREGQTLFIKGNSETKKMKGFHDTFYTKIISLNKHFSSKRKNYVYKPIESINPLTEKTWILNNYIPLLTML